MFHRNVWESDQREDSYLVRDLLLDIQYHYRRLAKEVRLIRLPAIYSTPLALDKHWLQVINISMR